MKTIIKNGRVIDPANAVDRVTPVFIDGQLIVAIDQSPDGFSADRVIDAHEQLVIPGLVDIQCRVREPGYTQKATIASETYAAARGGITSLCVPPDSIPVTDNSAVIELIHHSNQKAGNHCHLYTIGALTKGLEGEQLSNMGSLRKEGCIGLSNARAPFLNNLVQRRAMEYAAGLEIPVIIQPFDHSLYANGCAHEGSVSTRLGLPPIPEAAETAALARDIELVVQTGARTHFGQLSCARSVDMIRQAKKDGLPVSADVSIHQLFLTEHDIVGYDTNKYTIPPLRSIRDRDALREGLVDSTIDCICSDHQPNDRDAKLAPFPSAEPGCSTLDSFLPLVFRLIDQGLLNINVALSKITTNPARIFKLPAGQLAPGELADLCIVDPRHHFISDSRQFFSAGKNSPFNGWDFSAKCSHSMVAGRLID
jgi:dihydroorotase